jgi:hypothetical protein
MVWLASVPSGVLTEAIQDFEKALQININRGTPFTMEFKKKKSLNDSRMF